VTRSVLEYVWALRRRLASTVRRPRAYQSGPAERVDQGRDWSATVLEGDASIGYGYLDRWRRSARVDVAPIGAEGTSLRLFSNNAPDSPPATHPHVLVEATNLVVDFSRIGTRDQLESRPGYLRERGGYLDYLPGALLAAGTPSRVLAADLFPRDHLRDTFRSLAVSREATTVDDTVEEFCLFVSREPRELNNLFHAHTDWLSAYVTIRLLGVQEAPRRVVLLDPHEPGPLDQVFADLFSPAGAVLRRSEWGGRRIRFRHGVFVPPGYSSILWCRLHADTTVPPVGLLQDYGRFFRSTFCDRVEVDSDAPVQVTLVVRRPYPGKGPVLLRQFRSEEAVAAALRSMPGLAVQIVDLAAMSVGDQVRIASQTEILVGAHGAGLSHVFAVAEHGALVEVVAAPAASTYALYANLAGWTGRLYARFEAPERLGLGGSWLDPNPAELGHCVRALAARVRQRRRIGRT